MVKVMMCELDLNEAIWKKKKKTGKSKKKKNQVAGGTWPVGCGFQACFGPQAGRGRGPCPCQAHSGCQVHVQTNELQCQNKGSWRRKPKVPGLCSCIVGARGAAGGQPSVRPSPPGAPAGLSCDSPVAQRGGSRGPNAPYQRHL